MVVRAPDSTLNLGNFMRTQIYAIFSTLSLGMKVLEAQGVEVDLMQGHGGIFRTEAVADRMLAAALNVPVSVAQTASNGGSWGVAVLAAYSAVVAAGEQLSLEEFLAQRVFAGTETRLTEPQPKDVAGYAKYLEKYSAALAVQRTAIESI